MNSHFTLSKAAYVPSRRGLTIFILIKVLSSNLASFLKWRSSNSFTIFNVKTRTVSRVLCDLPQRQTGRRSDCRLTCPYRKRRFPRAPWCASRSSSSYSSHACLGWGWGCGRTSVDVLILNLVGAHEVDLLGIRSMEPARLMYEVIVAPLIRSVEEDYLVRNVVRLVLRLLKVWRIWATRSLFSTWRPVWFSRVCVIFRSDWLVDEVIVVPLVRFVEEDFLVRHDVRLVLRLLSLFNVVAPLLMYWFWILWELSK